MTKNPGIELLFVSADTPLSEALQRQSTAIEHGLPSGIVLVVDAERRLLGVVTDGDLRRATSCLLKSNGTMH